MHRFFNRDSSSRSRSRHARPSIAIPLYVYPSPAAWTPVFDFLDKNPATRLHLIVNPANGPGGSVPDDLYIENVARLNKYANTTIYGYVHTSWAERAMSEVSADIRTWAKWAEYSKADIHVDGIFVDEAPNKLDKIPYMSIIQEDTRVALGDKALVWTNPGTAVDTDFYEYADMVNAVENKFSFARDRKFELDVPSELRGKATVMLHSFRGPNEALKKCVGALSKAGYAAILLAESPTYTELPRAFMEELQR